MREFAEVGTIRWDKVPFFFLSFFYLKFTHSESRSGLFWNCSKKQLRTCKQAVYAHDPEYKTKAATIHYSVLSNAFLLFYYPVPAYRGWRVAHKEAGNSGKQETISNKWKSTVWGIKSLDTSDQHLWHYIKYLNRKRIPSTEKAKGGAIRILSWNRLFCEKPSALYRELSPPLSVQ